MFFLIYIRNLLNSSDKQASILNKLLFKYILDFSTSFYEYIYLILCI